MADTVSKAQTVELIDMPLLHPGSDFQRWRDRQGNRLIQWISRQKARRWAEMMDRKQHQVLAESVRAFRDARAKEA
ncbi:MAG: hypothetical protein AAF269_14105, partial [Pseudomonadota bacterium]